jgi:hypothetical protein
VFGAAGSETRAIQVADAVMQKLGGTAAWKQTLYLTWNHAGRRRYLWDRSGGQVRLERAGPRSGRPYVIVFHVEGGEGRAWREGEEVTEASELEPMLEAARMEWIRDSWWLLLPYKLRDAGVSLRYQGEGQTEEGRAADVLEVTFADAAAAPASRCLVWVARESGMVEQWAGYSGHDSTEPAWTCRWKGWKRFGDIMLCGDRGQVGGQPLELTDIAVLDKVPARSFASPDPIDWDKDGPQ